MTSTWNHRSHQGQSKKNENVYSRTIPYESKKLHPIDKAVNETLSKSLRVLTQVPTQNIILSHKLEAERYFSLKIREFLSFQMAHITAHTAHTQSDLIDLFHLLSEPRSSKRKRSAGTSVCRPNSLKTFTHRDLA